MRLGIQYPAPLTVLGHVELAEQADAWGYEAYAVTDPTVGNDPFPVLGALAMRTRRIGLATDVASMISRHPVTLAATARTIDDLSGGRMLLGLGTGHAERMEHGLGIPFAKPFSAMREAVRIIRGLLAGEAVDAPGERFRVRAKLDPPPQRRVPVYVGAIQPRMLRFSGAEADGVMLNHLIPDHAPVVIEEIRRGAIEAGRRPAEVSIIVSVPTQIVASEDEARQARATRKGMLVSYTGLEIYRRRYTAMGFGAEMEAAAAAQRRGEPLLSYVPDKLVEQMVNVGSPDDCRAVIDRYHAAGADIVFLAPICAPNDPGPFRRTLEALAPGGR